jgi:hypothetical protein
VIPQGTGWQHLRGLALGVIPAGTAVYHTQAVPLREWRNRGTYIVSACTKKWIVIEAAGVEIAEALLSDVEYLLDHSAEQQASVRNAVVGTLWYSPAWALVTAYYWGFFAALALTRLAGRSVWFLDRPSLNDLKTLAGANEQPNAGAMFISIGAYLSGTNRELILRPSKAQLHDAVWSVTQTLIKDILSHSDQAASPLEFRLWRALTRIGDIWGARWPSQVRNAANYQPGFAYREVIRRDRIDLMRRVRLVAPVSFESLIGLIEDDSLRVSAGSDPLDTMELSSGLLGLYSAALSAVARSLHSEVIDRQSGDRRWSGMRASFYAARCGAGPGSVWPLSE